MMALFSERQVLRGFSVLVCCVLVILFICRTEVSYISLNAVASTENVNKDEDSFPFEIAVTLLHNKTRSWSGRVDQADFLLAPEVADIPVNIFLPSSETEITSPDNPFPSLEDRTGPVNYFSIREGRKTQEVAGYLHFIVNRYDNLPNVTIFLHSGPQRHGEKILESIRHVVDHWTPEQVSFLHLNYDIFVCRAVNSYEDWHEMWMSLGFNGSHHPNLISVPCCAQFMVSKERIHLRPKSFYERFLEETYKWAYNVVGSGNFGYSFALFAEFHWHLIFGEPPILSNDRQVVHYMSSDWKKAVHPGVLYNPIPSLPYSDSMKPWYEKSVVDPDYFPIISKSACPPGSQFP